MIKKMVNFDEKLDENSDEKIKETEEDIQAKIEYDRLSAEYARFTNLKNQLYSVKRYLNESVKDLDAVSNKVINGYSIDSVSGDKGFLDQTKKKVKSIYNYLDDVIIPNINSNLNDISDAIEKLDLD